MLSRRSDYEANKFRLKQLFTKKNEALKLTKYSKDIERIIKNITYSKIINIQKFREFIKR